MGRPHDSLFRFTFSDPHHAAPLLRALLAPEPAAAIDWSTLARAPDDLVDEQQQEQHTDLLFTVRLAGRLVLLFLLLEHKSRPDKWTPLQLLGYIVGLWKQWRRRRPGRRLPPILPVVVHFGRGRWRTSSDLQSLVDLRGFTPAARAMLVASLPHFAFRPHDFASRSEAEIRAMALSLHGLWTVTCLQFVAPYGHDQRAARKALAECAGTFRAILDTPTGRLAWDALSSYLFKVTRLSRKRLEAVIRERIGPPAMKKFVSTYDQILQEGEVRGETRGRAQLLLRMLQKRFGRIPAATRKRVEQAPSAVIDRWAEAMLDAESLPDVFA